MISGRDHPELFLPHELFEEIVAGGAFDEGFRRVYAPMLEDVGLPPDFWMRLEKLSAPFVEDLRERKRPTKSAELDSRICRDRAIALRAARSAFGPALDRFMYDVVAPGRTDFLDRLSDEKTLRAREAGCQNL